MKKLIILISLVLINLSGYSQTIKASFNPEIHSEPFSGRIIAYLSKESKSPKDQSIGTDPFPCFTIDVENVTPGEKVIFDDKAISFPTSLSNIERGTYYIQIVWDRNLGGRAIGNSPGNLFNIADTITFTKNYEEIFEITANKIVAEPEPFIETEYIKELDVPSALLTEFYGRPTSLKAAIVLPKEYWSQPKHNFPVLYTVYGYGGDYRFQSGVQTPSNPLDTIPIIRVILDGNCPLGHSVYANSDNNGPWGDALVNELIPELEKKYRTQKIRLLTGHSSGGWSVLWLQIQYPKVFEGTWSSSPDPVDFEMYQNINLYQDSNMYYDSLDRPRYFATVAGVIPWGSMKNIQQMENVVYRGEQMQSFNAVFSDKGKAGLPNSICNSTTGEIDKDIVMQWSRYDITRILLKNWGELQADLQGKIRVSIGNQDNFLLQPAVKSLEKKVEKLNTRFEFAYYPGDHFTVWRLENYHSEGEKFLKERLLEKIKDNR